jgi:predicted MFS family arabinose efflux permease
MIPPTSPDEAPVQAPSKLPRLWSNRDYMLLWSGQAVSSLGTQVSTIAFPLLVLALTGSLAQAGFMGGLRALPYLIFSLPAGALIDRWDRKRVMIICDTGRALALGSIPVALLLGQLTMTQLYLVSAVEGTLFVFFNLAEVACLPRVVPPEQLPAAAAQNSATDGTSFLVGPALGGALFSLGQMLPFLGDAVSYAVSVISLLFIRTRFQGERTVVKRRLHVEIGEGLVWLWRQPLIRFMAFLTGSYNLLSAGYLLVIIALAKHMHASNLAIGVIFSIAGIGAIVGSILGAPLQKRLRFPVVIIGTTLVSMVLWPPLIFAPNIWWLGAISAVSFLMGPIYNVTQFSYRLALIPDLLQGRVNSVFRLLAFGGQPLGLALTGLALENIGADNTIWIIFAGFVVMSLSTILNKHVRGARPVEELQPAA